MKLHYGGYCYRLIGSKYLTIWFCNYKESTVVKSTKYQLQFCSKFFRTKLINI